MVNHRQGRRNGHDRESALMPRVPLRLRVPFGLPVPLGLRVPLGLPVPLGLRSRLGAAAQERRCHRTGLGRLYRRLRMAGLERPPLRPQRREMHHPSHPQPPKAR